MMLRFVMMCSVERASSTLLTMIFITILSCLLGCQGTPDSQQNHGVETTHTSKEKRPDLIKVTDETQQLLFLFKDKKGEEGRAMSISEIPIDSRNQVQVIDLSRSPEQRGSRAYVQLFDLSTASKDGVYRGRIVKRGELERALASAQALPEQPPIILYSTSWCGVCKKARRFMEEKGLAFIEKDIEKDREAARELQEKSERAKVPLGGVPVIDVGGQLMRGFDANRLLSMLKAK